MEKIKELVKQLKSEGWMEQKAGTNYFNGEYGTNLFKDGEMITILQNTMPDEETVEELFGEE